MQLIVRNILTSSYMCAKFVVCHHLEMKAVPSLDGSALDWKGYVVKHNYVKQDVLITILDNYMFRPLLAIFRLSSREFKFLLYIMCAQQTTDVEISLSRVCAHYV